MNVCQFSSNSVEGIYFSYIAAGLTKKGAKTSFVTLNEAAKPAWMGGHSGVGYRSFNINSRILFPLAVLRLARYLAKNKVDILHTHLFEAALVGLAAARLARTPVTIVSRHHLDEARLLGSTVHITLDEWSNRAADCVVVPSEATRRFMVDVEGQRGTDIRVIPLGFDFAAMNADDSAGDKVRLEMGLQDGFVIGCVGRFFKNKGHSYLLEALADVVKIFPDVKLLLIGSGDSGFIDELVAKHGLSKNVIFAGYRTDIPACMRAMDLFVHPSLSESFGQVIVEAMAVGTPVLVTSVGGVPEIVDDGETGVVVPPKEAGALASAILRLIRDPDLRIEIGKAGKASVSRRFTVTKLVDSHWKLYEELLSKN